MARGNSSTELNFGEASLAKGMEELAAAPPIWMERVAKGVHHTGDARDRPGDHIALCSLPAPPVLLEEGGRWSQSA